MVKHIAKTICIHGAGFSYGESGIWADRHVMSLVAKEQPTCLFLPHSTDDAIRYSEKFHRIWSPMGAKTRTLSLFTPETADIESYILEADIIYVAGGNTKSMLCLWREWGLDYSLRLAYEQGIVLCGMSAGAICWFEEGFSDSIPDRYICLQGLGFLAGICNPHHVGKRAEEFEVFCRDNDRGDLIGVPDNCLMTITDNALAEIILKDGTSPPLLRGCWSRCVPSVRIA
jgi:peptidase E